MMKILSAEKKNMNSKRVLSIAFILSIFTIFIANQTSVVSDSTNFIYVGGSGDGNYTIIQKAVNNASDGDTIYVYSGFFYENIVINKSIALIGEKKHTTIIDGGIKDTVIEIISDEVTITGFTIQSSSLVFPKAGINISSSSVIITDNLIHNNYYGITLFHASNSTISDNIISDDDHCGIYMSGSKDNVISSNSIRNHSYNGIGIYDSSDSNTIISNELMDNSYCGINIHTSLNNNITGNEFIENNIGIKLGSSKYPNYESDNIFSGNIKNIEKPFEVPLIFTAFLIGATFVTLAIVFYLEQKKQKNNVSKKSTHILDARGRPCPIPLIMAKKKIKKIKKGDTLRIISDDIVAKENLERFGIEKHELVNIEEKDGLFNIFIKKK